MDDSSGDEEKLEAKRPVQKLLRMPETSKGVQVSKGVDWTEPTAEARLREPVLPGLLSVQQVAPLLLRNGGGQPMEKSHQGEQTPPNFVHSIVLKSSHFRSLLGVAWTISLLLAWKHQIFPKPSSGSETPFPTWTLFYTPGLLGRHASVKLLLVLQVHP